MQYLVIDEKDTILSLTKIVGQNNIEEVLAQNSLQRTPGIGKAWKKKCDDYLATDPPEVSGSRKQALLNNLTDSSELFEKACLMDEDEWKIYSAFQAFPDAILLPESVQLPYSSKVIGSTNDTEALESWLGNGASNISSNPSWAISAYESAISPVTDSSNRTTTYRSNVTSNRKPAIEASLMNTDPISNVTYKAVMAGLKETSKIDPSVLERVNTSTAKQVTPSVNTQTSSVPYTYNLPWGKIQIYSTVLDQTIDIPVYPETIETMRTANYTSMQDIIYQYEPWIAYSGSGPREQSISFHLHRDLWTGNHLDGNANKLIRFCEANTYPNYSGSFVVAPKVRIYIAGETFISGVITNTTVTWSGPLGQDSWYLEFNLSLTLQEVSDFALNASSVNSLGLIGAK